MGTLLDIGTDLVAQRRTSGVSQRELGRRLGVSQPQIARWEACGYSSASLTRLDAVATALDHTVAAEPEILAAEQTATYLVSLPGSQREALDALARTGVDAAAIAAFARSHGIGRVDLFGSVLTDAFGPTSDVDMLATYDADRTPSLLDLADHERELEAIFRRSVDLVSRAGVESSHSYLRRREILGSARTLYARS